MSRVVLKEMFTEMVEKKNSDLIAKYYHPDFVLLANGQQQDYDYFLDYHKKIYQSEIAYRIRYDEEAFIEQADAVAARVFISISSPNEPTKDLEVILLAKFKDNKIIHIKELCYPDWSTMPEFEI